MFQFFVFYIYQIFFVSYQHFFPFQNKEKTLCYHFNKIINNLCYSNMLNKYKLGLHFRGQHFFMSHKRYLFKKTKDIGKKKTLCHHFHISY